ncbi:MAG: hypothetical protein ABSE59_08715 [Opitutaceae bacterium]|jgi:hypothetical protein
MKVNLLFLAAALTAASLTAAPLTETTAVQIRPRTDSPAIAVLKAGTEATPAVGVAAPSGWLAVELRGPFEAYVQNRDFLKNLDVRPGAPIRTSPKLNAPVLTTAARGDSIEITGLFGKWTQIKLSKRIVGYIQFASAPAARPPAALPDVAAMSAPSPVVVDSNAPGHAVSSSTYALPRLLEGKFLSTRHPFTPRRPYDYELDDVSGNRVAYVDISHLLLTARIQNYITRTVDVYGSVKPINNGNDLVISAESLQLK